MDQSKFICYDLPLIKERFLTLLYIENVFFYKNPQIFKTIKGKLYFFFKNLTTKCFIM